jgi:hypothetical protein
MPAVHQIPSGMRLVISDAQYRAPRRRGSCHAGQSRAPAAFRPVAVGQALEPGAAQFAGLMAPLADPLATGLAAGVPVIRFEAIPLLSSRQRDRKRPRSPAD